MDLSRQFLFFFSALGVFNGLIVGLYLLLFRKSKSASSYFLGLLLLAICFKIGKSFIYYFYPQLPGVYIQLGILGSAFVGPALFHFIQSALNQQAKITGRQYWIYLFWTVSLLIVGIVLPYDNNPALWNSYIGTAISAQLIVCLLLDGWLLRNALAKIFVARAKISTAEGLLLSVYIGNLIIPAAFKLSIFDFFNGPCISAALFFSLILYLNVFLFAGKRKTSGPLLGSSDLERYANRKIADEQALFLTDKLQRIITEEQLYKNPDLKLNDLARKINISAHQLSQLLNDNLGKSFASYINEFRINEACALIANDRGIKLEAIGYEVGFNSKSTFYAAFKKLKQTTPTLYKEQLNLNLVGS